MKATKKAILSSHPSLSHSYAPSFPGGSIQAGPGVDRVGECSTKWGFLHHFHHRHDRFRADLDNACPGREKVLYKLHFLKRVCLEIFNLHFCHESNPPASPGEQAETLCEFKGSIKYRNYLQFWLCIIVHTKGFLIENESRKSSDTLPLRLISVVVLNK